MKRKSMQELLEWKESKYRKPLILKGARQVGKTWLLKEFGKRHYKNVAYFNFDENPEYKEFFLHTKDVDRILENLTLASGHFIDHKNPENTLIIFDEIQESPQALNSLKYFYENRPDYHLVTAGSLLGISLAKPASFPVGKVDFLKLGPMTFTEFLWANADDNLSDYMERISEIEPVAETFYNQLTEKLKSYLVTGGMPEAVWAWTKEKDVKLVEQILANILMAYEQDFGKHPDKKETRRIRLIWKSIPSQLAKENKKFIYRVVKEGARAREYEDAIQWLNDANLLYKIYRISKPGLPLAAYDDLSAFKLYLLDVGLLRRMSGLAPTIFAEKNRLFTEFRGALTENYILQSLDRQFEQTPRYWAIDSPKHEVDYIIQKDNFIIPIEVKADKNLTSKSLTVYKEKFNNVTPIRVRFSLANLKLDGNILNIPLFLADETDRLIEIALENLDNENI